MDMSLLAKAGSPRSRMVFHENPEELHTGTLPDHAYFIPFGKGQDPFGDRFGSERVELLNGQWDFKYYDSLLSLDDDFINMPFEDKIPVLGDLPFIGFLFRSTGEYSEKRNLLIFLTARLVDPAGRPLKTATDGRTGTSVLDQGSSETMSSTAK